jgi:5'-nucleotidase
VRILVTNDDGIDAIGLKSMALALNRNHTVAVVAPERERSGSGHAITLHRPLQVTDRPLAPRIPGWAVTGTPADCVKLAVQALMPDPPDLVVAGINHGPNLGRDVFYSGTVSAAVEAHFLGLRALAVSCEEPTAADLERSAAAVADWIERGLGVRGPALLNVNFPPWRRMRAGPRLVTTRLGRREYVAEFERRVDPRGRPYYWLAGRIDETEEPADTDVGAVARGCVAVSPLRIELTVATDLAALRPLVQGLNGEC